MWIHLSFALLLQAAPRVEPSVGASSRPIVTPARSANTVVEAANRAVIGFLATWRTAWHSSAQASGSSSDDTRLRDVHCRRFIVNRWRQVLREIAGASLGAEVEPRRDPAFGTWRRNRRRLSKRWGCLGAQSGEHDSRDKPRTKKNHQVILKLVSVVVEHVRESRGRRPATGTPSDALGHAGFSRQGSRLRATDHVNGGSGEGE